MNRLVKGDPAVAGWKENLKKASDSLTWEHERARLLEALKDV
jgi:hypothetical protein